MSWCLVTFHAAQMVCDLTVQSKLGLSPCCHFPSAGITGLHYFKIKNTEKLNSICSLSKQREKTEAKEGRENLAMEKDLSLLLRSHTPLSLQAPKTRKKEGHNG